MIQPHETMFIPFNIIPKLPLPADKVNSADNHGNYIYFFRKQTLQCLHAMLRYNVYPCVLKTYACLNSFPST